MNKKWLLRIVKFCLMVGVMFLMTGIRSQNSGDRINKEITLIYGKTTVCTIDLAKQGHHIKKLLCPNMCTAYLRFKSPDSRIVYCIGKSSDMEMFLSQGTKKGIWIELRPNDNIKQKGESISVNVELKFPREAVSNHNVADGMLTFYDALGEYAKVMIKVVNSQH